MNEKFNKNAKVEQLTKMFLSHEEEKGLIVKSPYSDSNIPIDSDNILIDLISSLHDTQVILSSGPYMQEFISEQFCLSIGKLFFLKKIIILLDFQFTPVT